jgi:hypothetical protein
VRTGLEATSRKINDLVFPIRDPGTIKYHLPRGFRVSDMKETFDIYRYGQVIWKGFNHEADGEGPFVFSDSMREGLTYEMLRPNVDLTLKVMTISPNGNFASYCDIWYDPATENAVVELVAADHAYRKRGLGRAAVLEGIRRCGLLGAKRAYVSANLQFYYSIGFRPRESSIRWRIKIKRAEG